MRKVTLQYLIEEIHQLTEKALDIKKYDIQFLSRCSVANDDNVFGISPFFIKKGAVI